jgi:hypothetical protein
MPRRPIGAVREQLMASARCQISGSPSARSPVGAETAEPAEPLVQRLDLARRLRSSALPKHQPACYATADRRVQARDSLAQSSIHRVGHLRMSASSDFVMYGVGSCAFSFMQRGCGPLTDRTADFASNASVSDSA